MPPAKKAVPVKAVAKPGPPDVPARLADASASGHPTVQYLIAQRHAHAVNGDAAGVEAVNAELARLGFK